MVEIWEELRKAWYDTPEARNGDSWRGVEARARELLTPAQPDPDAEAKRLAHLHENTRLHGCCNFRPDSWWEEIGEERRNGWRAVAKEVGRE